ncbi:retrotransposon protein, putative, ty1-copia subclass [Tanacetum coccineum]
MIRTVGLLVIVAWNAKFFENSLITQEASGSLEDLEVIQDKHTHPSENTSLHHDVDEQEIVEPQSDVNPVRRSTRTHRAPNRMCLYVDAEEHELRNDIEPNNYKVALSDHESEKWLDAMNMEIHRWKDIRAIGILIAIVAFYDYEIWQMDVKTAFLNGHLPEEVYMVQPKGFVNLKDPNQVCKLKRSIYGIKQVSRQGNKRFDEEIKKFGFTQNCDEPLLQEVKSYLGKCFAMKDLGEAAYILGIKIYRDRSRRSQGASIPNEVKRMQRVPYASAVGSIITKQSITATSSTKVEYMAASEASKEAVWIRKFISELGVVSTNEEPMKMYCDNTRAISIANESGITKGAKHYHTKVDYLREVIKLDDIKLDKAHTYDNVADPFTKASPFNKHSEHTMSIGLLPASSLM